MQANRIGLVLSTTTERPPSTSSVRFTTRQRLQQSDPQQIHRDTNQNNSSMLNSPKKSRRNSSVDDISDTSKAMQNLVSPNSFQNLILRKIHRDAVEVSICCIFVRVGDIDTLNERYYGEFLLEASWEEPSFKGLQSRPFDPSIRWTPELELMNGIGELQDDVTYSVHHNKQGFATVTEHHRLKGTLWERMELHHFPVDVQELSLSITSSRTDKEVTFIRDLRKPSGVNRRVFTDEQEWYLFEYVDIEVTHQIDEYLDDVHNHPVVICSCYAARKYGYFIWNAYFLIFLITSASFTTFPIPLSNIHGRIQIACTLLLTSITFRWLCNKALP
ncbi:unnamed protein product [Adineta ricciae]|nr:unnamed protein product [Adineta ricciae]